MTRAPLAVGCAILALASCRAIVGVEPLELADAGADGASAHDGGDAASTGGDSGRTDTCTGSQCRGCCRQFYGQAFDTIAAYAVDAGCICGASNQCNQDCATASCASPPEPPVPPCGPCTDNALVAPSPTTTTACAAAIDRCRSDPSCGPAINCLLSCP